MSEQIESATDELEADDAEYEGDLGDGAKKGASAGIIGIDASS